MKNERMKADLITNVSHDIKTPLTSIINYVNLLENEKIENEKVNNYIHILKEKSYRLEQLTEDLVEASQDQLRQYCVRDGPDQLSGTGLSDRRRIQ